ncbi:hypothetical protein V8C26DRAFT_390609 [Trichoderma gracile]
MWRRKRVSALLPLARTANAAPSQLRFHRRINPSTAPIPLPTLPTTLPWYLEYYLAHVEFGRCSTCRQDRAADNVLRVWSSKMLLALACSALSLSMNHFLR